MKFIFIKDVGINEYEDFIIFWIAYSNPLITAVIIIVTSENYHVLFKKKTYKSLIDKFKK
jgi:hypothetical protein